MGKVYPSHGAGDQPMAGVTVSHAAGGDESGTNDVLGPPSDDATNATLRRKPSVLASLTEKLAIDMKATEITDISADSDIDVFKRLRENAEKRYAGGDTPMVIPMATDPSFKYVINPNTEVMRYWDLATTFCLIFTMSVTPFEVAFLVPKIDALFFVNRFVDLVFLIDIVLNFFLMYIDRGTGKWVSQLRVIQVNYLRGTFALDVVSILPFDVIGIVMNSPAVSQLKVLRILRLLKLAKLIRVLRAGRLVRRLETTFSINYSAMQLYGFGATVLVVAHWLACLFRLAPALQVDEPWLTQDNWIGVMSGEDSEFNGESVAQQYVAALYWAIMTMTTIGYGDIPVVSTMERLFVMVGMIVGTCVFTYLIGAVTGIMEQVNAAQQRFFNQMDMVNTFVFDYNVDKALRVKIREYFRYKNQQGSVYDYHTLLEEMSPELRKEVAVSTQTEWVKKLKFMRGTCEDFMAELVMKLNHSTYPANEFVLREGDPPNRLIFINKGVVVCRGRVHTAGSVIGEDMLYSKLRRTFSARTLTFVSVFELNRPDLLNVVDKYPLDKAIIKRRAVREAFKVEIIAYAHALEIIAKARELGVLNKMFVLADGLDVKRLLLGKYEAFVSVITDNVQREQLINRMYHFLPKQFRHHYIGARDVWYVAKLVEQQDQLVAGLRIQRAVKRWQHKIVFRKKYLSLGTQVHTFPKWLTNITLTAVHGIDLTDPAIAALNQRKMMLAIHHMVLHAKTTEAKISEELSDIKQMLTQLGAKVPPGVEVEQQKHLTSLRDAREATLRRGAAKLQSMTVTPQSPIQELNKKEQMNSE